jgi:hypothetical protein
MTRTHNEQHDSPAEEFGIAQAADLDCLALGCEWDWYVIGCGRCGGSHTVRICARCLVAPDDEVCPVTVADEDGSGVAA